MTINYSKTFFLTLFTLLGTIIFAQDDPILFSVGDAKVGISEFDYIYSKTNGKAATYSEQSINEYLDLYIKFKLKVQEAKRLEMDTIPKLQRELDSYRRQLADNYLMDKEVTEKLAQEAYQRMQKDVKVRHILAAVAEDATDKQVKAAYEKALMIKKELDRGVPFGKVAVKFSDHKPTRIKGGDLGYMTAMLPKGFYNLETAVFDGEKNVVSEPIRTKLGYHIIKVDSVREARGKMELAHILIRNKESRADQKEKALIDTAYARLNRGEPFEDLSATMSEDKQSASKKGYIGIYGIGLLEPIFEDMAFALTDDGAYSKPFQSSVGWHIVRRISKRGGEPYEVLKEQIIKNLQQTERQELAKQSLIEKIKVETAYKLDESVLQDFIDRQTEQFFTYKWKPTGENGEKVLFQLKGEQPQTIDNFEVFIARAARARLRMADQEDVGAGVREIYDLFLEEVALKYEEKNLLRKYSDFRNLMREYEEGILLFEVTDQEVWSKASKDTTGLRNYFGTIEGKFRWADKAKVTTYVVNSTNDKLISKIRKYATKKGTEKLLKKFNKKSEMVSVSTEAVEKGRDKNIDQMNWQPNSLSAVMKKEGTASFKVIDEVVPGKPKTLKESRGYVIADYQEYLEKQWIEQLRTRYPLKLNKEVLKSLIKS